MKPAHVCRHLRTKKMYIPAQVDDVFSASGEQPEHSGHCWCNRTLTEVGFDDKLAGLQSCNPTRPCFED